MAIMMRFQLNLAAKAFQNRSNLKFQNFVSAGMAKAQEAMEKMKGQGMDPMDMIKNMDPDMLVRLILQNSVGFWRVCDYFWWIVRTK